MTKRIFSLFVFLIPFFLFSQTGKPKKVILMIGDGMGFAQVTALTSLKPDANINRFSYKGESKTYCLTDSVTDSAAGGSALSTGKKTKKYAVAVDINGNPNETLMEWAKKRGMATGIVVTCGVTHATPASFYAHVKDRKEDEMIAYQFKDSQIDVLIGGGRSYFDPKYRKDGINLFDSLEKRKYGFVYDVKEIPSYNGDKLVALVTKKHPKNAVKRGNLAESGIKKALSILEKDPDGFVMMIEGSQIDWACHVNNFSYFQKEILDFDKVIGDVLDYAQKDGETLVIVTADHETGNMQVKYPINPDKVKASFSFKSLDHTGKNVPVFAFGPGAENFQGVMENTDIPLKIKELLDK